MKLFLLAFLFSTLAIAAEKNPDGVVELNTKVYPEKAFRKNKRVLVKPLEKMVAHPDAIPTKEEREAAFARVPGLGAHTEKLDELDRDLLYMRARNDSAAELQAKHPSIPKEILQRLQAEVKKPQ